MEMLHLDARALRWSSDSYAILKQSTEIDIDLDPDRVGDPSPKRLSA